MARGGAGQLLAAMRARGADSVRVASDPAAGWYTLWYLAVRDWLQRPVARALAANPRAPRLLLRCLCLRSRDVEAAVAANPRCPAGLHKSMVWHSDWAVRAAVAANPAAAPGALKDLITGSGPHVRLYAAANSSLTQALADRLLVDPDPYVRAVAAAHPAASSAGLQRLAQDMSQPAWVLRAAAGNPACAQELADQLLTWIALGGPGPSDPLFDPLECEGHPGDTRSTSYAWYLEQARGPDADRHPLWQVRALVMAGQGRISGERARALARDPRPEVRRSMAAAAQLPLALRRELAGDVDPQVARVAAAAAARSRKADLQRRNQRTSRNVAVLLVRAAMFAVGLSAFMQQVGQSGSGVAPGVGKHSGSCQTR